MYLIKISSTYLLLLTLNVFSIPLSGKWEGSIPSRDISFTTEIPSGIYTDLEKAGLIPKNLMEFNDVQNRWVAKESVSYTTDIEVNKTILNASHVVLTFHGVDTFSTIFINNVEVGRTSNMFLKYNFDIKRLLKDGNNEVKLVFESPVKVAEQLYNLQSLSYIIPPKCVPKEYNGECHVNHIRKMQASFSWDWGPAFPSMGIWKNVELQPIQNVLVSEITSDILKKSKSWEVTVTIFFETFGKKNVYIKQPIQVICNLEEQYFNESILRNLEINNNHAHTTVTLNVPLETVHLWWPNGYGQQKLYTLKIKVKSENDITEKKIRIGFRTVELVQEPLEKGLSFYFKVNGISIFAKGSNWIPSSVFPERSANKATLQQMFKSVKDTHMNMLRVWGGGVYESDLFYDLADENGIMIWQDFMFACNMYPTTRSFLNEVKEEVRQNMRRLKHHPSIVLWAGNNENEAALYGNWYGTGAAQVYKDDYVKLYVDTIKQEAVKIDTAKPFIVSSPSNGLYSEEKNYTESNPYSNFYGDVHYYNYLKNSWDINQYPVTRFASEYGLQALPSIWTLMSATKNSNDLQLNSPFMKHRQHLPQGYNFMKLLISKNFIIPESDSTIRELIDYIYLSQVTQAVAMKIETELYRQMKSSFNSLGEGLTMGALYWQLNDVWQAPSWSSIDFQGRWKMLHYYTKDFFAPVIITSHLSKADQLLIYVVSDLLDSLINVGVEIIVYEWKSAKPIHTSRYMNVTVKPNESRLVTEYWLDKFLEEAGCGDLATARKNCIVELTLRDVNGKQLAPNNYVFPYPLKDVSLPKDSISVTILPEASPSKLSNQLDFEIEVTSQKIALFVWLEIGNVVGQFSENGFHILQGKKKIVFHTNQAVTVKDISKNLIITSLSRIYDSDLRTSDVRIVVNELN